MVVGIATMRFKDALPVVQKNFIDNMPNRLPPIHWIDNASSNIGLVSSYQRIYEENKYFGTICYLHDDVTINERDWDLRIAEELNDPTVGVIGFGGAIRHGSRDLYKVSYQLSDLARHDYYSNTEDWQVHGKQLTEPMDVAALDGFALIVRRELLDKAGGWPVNQLRFHCYDYWLCAMAHRLGYRVRAIPVRCFHHGGATSTRPEYQDWCKKKGFTDAQDHAESHRWFYDEFRDVMPWGWPRL